MPDPKRLQVFISSPSDVDPERVVAERVVGRLDREFSAHATIRAVRWEREPLRATRHFQEEIPSASETDIVIVILWSFLGTPLRDDLRGAISGNVVTGTEFEFEDAVKAFREHGRPDVLVYQKEGVPPFQDDGQVEQYLKKRARVKEFFSTWFKDEDGSLKAAWRTFKTTADFEELLDQHLPELIRRHLGYSRSSEARARIDWYEGSPFRGLETFEVHHAPIFFGRTRARHELREILVKQVGRRRPWVVVLGASGSGKSSLVKAGFIPDITTPGLIEGVGLCRFAMMRPSDEGGDLIAGLTRALLATESLPELVSLQYDALRLKELLARGGRQASLPIEQGLASARTTEGLLPHANARLALIIDQLEEVFPAEPERSRLTAFLSALDGLAASGFVWIVATLRSDFLREFEANRGLAERFEGSARYFLSAPSEPELRQIITRPAEAAGLSFSVDADKGLGLDEAIAAAARDEPTSLPLLEYLLDQLWRRRSDRGELTWEGYRALGGLEGAIGSRAEAVFQSLSVEAQSALPKVVRALVTVVAPEEDARPTAQWAAMDRFPERSPARALVDAMLAREARLLVADESDRVRVAHEAVLSHWKRAAAQIRADTADLKVRARLQAQTKRWAAAAANDQPSLLLAPGLPLSEAEDLLARRPDELDGTLVSYIDASRAAHQDELEQERRQQVRLRDVVRMAAVRQVSSDPARRVALLREFEDPIHARGWMAVVSETVRNLAWHAALPQSRDDQYDHLALSGDGSILVARGSRGGADVSAVVWRVGWIGLPRRWTAEEAWVGEDGHVESRSSGKDPGAGVRRVLPAYLWLGIDGEDRLLTLSADTTLRIARIQVEGDLRDDGRLDSVEQDDASTSSAYQRIAVPEVLSLPPARRVVPAVAVGHAPGCRHFAILQEDGVLLVWHLDDDSAPVQVPIAQKGGASVRLHVSPDGRSMVLHDPLSGSATLVQAGADLSRERHLGNDVSAVEFSAKGAWVVTAHGSGPARVESTSDPALRIELHAESPPVTAVAFMPGRTAVTTGDAAGTIQVLPFDAGASRSTHLRDSWTIETVHLEGGFTRVAIRADTPLLRYTHDAEVSRIVPSPDGRSTVTISTDGTAILARLDGPGGVSLLRTDDERVADAVFSADGRWVATVGPGIPPHVWRVDGRVEPEILWRPPWVSNGVAGLAVEATPEGEVVWTRFGANEIRRSRMDGTGPTETFKFEGDLRLRTSARGQSDADLRWTSEQMEGEEARLFPIRSGHLPFILHGLVEHISIVVSPDERWVVGITDKGAAFVWSVADSRIPRPLGDGRTDVSAAAFSPEGRWIATGTTSGAVLVWNGDGTGQPTQVANLDQKVARLTFNADGAWLLAKGEGGRAMFVRTSGEAATDCGVVMGARFIGAGGTVLAVLADSVVEIAPGGSIRIRRFLPRPLGGLELISPDGRWILLRQGEEGLLLVSTLGELEPAPLPAGGASITATACSPDGSRVLTGHGDGSVRIWSADLDPRSLVERLWRATPYCLSLEERQTLLAEDLETARKHRKAALDAAYGYHAESLSRKARSEKPMGGDAC